MEKHEINRIHNLIKNSIDKVDLNLSGKTILTEVGSGYFVFTPIIALIANAEKVYAWVKDSGYGKADDIVNTCNSLISYFGLPNKIVYGINSRPEEHIKDADIITNLGFVRPLHSEFLKHVSKQSVISGMCEAWELRPSDIDLECCKKNGIAVAGTWENHPDFRIFDGCGHLAVKMAHEAGYEVYQNNIVIWSNDHFGDVVAKTFNDFGANKIIKTTNANDLLQYARDLDFIFFCDYKEQKQIIGPDGFIEIKKLQEANEGIGIVHLYGNIDNATIKENGMNVYPDKKGRASVMTYTLAHLGPIPIINLHTAGLKVGQCLSEGKESPLVQLV